ncbi:MAG: ATP-binding protein [Selenomonadaceae bacterium]|nr:ATP-binding protein [Selenomonadaceae bacterium]
MEKITVEAKVDNLQDVISFATERLEEHDCSMKTIMQIELVLEEIFVNIASYAYKDGGGSATISLDFNHQPRAVEITFTDSGEPYNPLEQEDPDTTLDVDERGIGGLGIFLVKKNVDEITYKYEDNKNILSIKKFF